MGKKFKKSEKNNNLIFLSDRYQGSTSESEQKWNLTNRYARFEHFLIGIELENGEQDQKQSEK